MHLKYSPKEGSVTTYYTDKDGRDEDVCGWRDFPCKSLTQVKTKGGSDVSEI